MKGIISDDGSKPGSPKTPTKKAVSTKRTVFTKNQLSQLEKRFTEQTFLSKEERGYLADELGLTEKQIMIWFQNRRGRLKRRGPADMAYTREKLKELHTRRPYPFLYGLLSSVEHRFAASQGRVHPYLSTKMAGMEPNSNRPYQYSPAWQSDLNSLYGKRVDQPNSVSSDGTGSTQHTQFQTPYMASDPQGRGKDNSWGNPRTSPPITTYSYGSHTTSGDTVNEAYNASQESQSSPLPDRMNTQTAFSTLQGVPSYETPGLTNSEIKKGEAYPEPGNVGTGLSSRPHSASSGSSTSPTTGPLPAGDFSSPRNDLYLQDNNTCVTWGAQFISGAYFNMNDHRRHYHPGMSYFPSETMSDSSGRQVESNFGQQTHSGGFAMNNRVATGSYCTPVPEHCERFPMYDNYHQQFQTPSLNWNGNSRLTPPLPNVPSNLNMNTPNTNVLTSVNSDMGFNYP